MEINFKRSGDYILAHKPSGISTHAVNEYSPGFVEMLSEMIGINLLVCHRLDKETSGSIIFATNKDAAEKVRKAFENDEVKKEYFFISEEKVSWNEKHVSLSIEKDGKNSKICRDSSPNSETFFKKIEENKLYSLWQAIPITGKTHQIRIHAKEIGIPIAGDDVYNKENFTHTYRRLMLHCKNVTIESLDINHESLPPLTFSEIKNLQNSRMLSSLILGLERRESIFKYADNEALRVSEYETKNLVCDKLGEVAWFYWYKDIEPDEDIDKVFDKFREYTKTKHWLFSPMQVSIPRSFSESCPEQWIITENNLKFLCKKSHGNSPGFFIDQRSNREWVQKNSKNKRVLNLFSYTGSFSVNAAIGEASKVVSIDTNKGYLDWSKENFTLNSLDPNSYSFLKYDSIEYLKKCSKKADLFDLIIIDPPSFSRSKEGVFSITKDVSELLQSAASVLSEGGKILFSSNYEKWSLDEILEIIDRALPEFKISERCSDVDVGYPWGADKMKSFILTIQNR